MPYHTIPNYATHRRPYQYARYHIHIPCKLYGIQHNISYTIYNILAIYQISDTAYHIPHTRYQIQYHASTRHTLHHAQINFQLLRTSSSFLPWDSFLCIACMVGSHPLNTLWIRLLVSTGEASWKQSWLPTSAELQGLISSTCKAYKGAPMQSRWISTC